MSDQFDQITQNYHAKPKRQPMSAATAIGTLLILTGILAIIPFGFGADRFLWIAAGTGGAGVILLAAGAFAPKK